MYGKLFASCFTGSMSGSGADMFAVWAYILANSNIDGIVELNPKLIAVMIGMPEENVNIVIKKLCQPDPISRSKDEDGKRLIRMGEFAYQIVNYLFYRAMQTKKNQNEYMRKYMKEKRDAERTKLLKCANVNGVNTPVRNVSTHVEVEAEVDVEVEGEVKAKAHTEGDREVVGEKEGDCLESYNEAVKERRANLRKKMGI